MGSYHIWSLIILGSTVFHFLSIIGEHPLKRDTDLAQKDDYPLPYSAQKSLLKGKNSKYNEMGFGAAGLPPLSFSHLARNWKNMQHIKSSENTQREGVLYLDYHSALINVCTCAHVSRISSFDIFCDGWRFVYAWGGAIQPTKDLHGDRWRCGRQ